MIGTGLFWLLWPVWVVYFRFSGSRSRVLVVVGDEVLVVNGWLSTKDYDLPGGGNKKHETSAASAVRELQEETGIVATESNLTILGRHKHSKYAFRYTADYFVLKLPEKPELKLKKLEIFTARWIKLNDTGMVRLGDDARYAISHYKPLEQGSLL